jgi:hypothetical protein
VNINLGQSSDPAVEADVLSDVATYGKQLGRIGDALAVLLAHFHPRQPLNAQEKAAINALKEMLDKIADVKERHKRAAVRPDAVSSAPYPLVRRAGAFTPRHSLDKSPAAPGTSEPGPLHLKRIRRNIAAFPSEEARWSTCNKEQIGALTDSPKRPRAWRSERA